MQFKQRWRRFLNCMALQAQRYYTKFQQACYPGDDASPEMLVG